MVFGSPAKAGKESSHGALGKDEVAATRAALGWKYGEFEIRKPSMQGGVVQAAPEMKPPGMHAAAYKAAHPEAAAEVRAPSVRRAPGWI